MNETIYLDSAAISKPLPCALRAYNKAITDYFGNPSSAHAVGQQAREALEDARRRIAYCIGAKPQEIYFVSNATEGAAIAVESVSGQIETFVISPYEHHSVSENFNRSCWTAPEKFGTTLYIQMLVGNETGKIYEMPKKMREQYLIFCDLTAAVGHVPIDVNDLGIDYAVFSAQKFGGVPGAGVLYAREGCPIAPNIAGGGQERGIRPGTENVPAICAMAAALEWQCEHMEENSEHVAGLWAEMFHLLTNSGLDYQFNVDTGPGARHSPYIMNVSFPGVEGSALALYLSNQGVMVSAGAACSNGKNEPSHVIMAMYDDEARARSAIRISFSHKNTLEEVRVAAEKIAEAVKTLRGFSAEQQQ